MTELNIQAIGELHASALPHTYTGDLIRWGEEGQTNLGRLTFDQGTLSFPKDPSALAVNYGHDPHTPVARITHLEDTGEVLRAAFLVAETEEGAVLEAEIADGTRKALSVDVKDVIVRAGKAVGGRLYGAAFVPKGAFPSAVLHAEIVPDTEADEPEATEQDPAIAAIVRAAQEAMATLMETLKSFDLPAETDPETTDEADAEPEAETPITTETEKETPMADATVTTTLAASASTEDTSLGRVLHLIGNAKMGDNDARTALASISERQTLHAAIADIKYDSTGSLGKGVVQPGFVGELWSGRRYERKIIPLLSSGPLLGMESKGWRFVNKPVVAAWAGNKTELPTSTATTQSYTYTAQRFGHAVDIAREFYDFNETGVIQRFLELVVDSYAEVSDNYVFTQLLANATAVEANVAVGTRSPGVTKLLQGIRAVDAARGNASFAIVADDVFEEILFSQDKEKLEFVSGQVGLNSGTLFGLNFVRHEGLADGEVIVGDKNAATVEELAGSPIRINAVDLVRGGYDEAIVAYIAARFDKPSALVRISDGD